MHTQWGSFSSQRRLRYFALLLELKDRSGVVGYTVVIFSAHFVAAKCEFFTTSSTMEIQLCARPATQLTHSPYFRQIAYTSPLRMREYLSERGLYEFWDNHQSSLEHEWSKSHSPNHPCVTSVCVCRVAQGVKNNLFSQGSLWNFRTGLTTGLGLTVFGC